LIGVLLVLNELGIETVSVEVTSDANGFYLY
jgi:hypothetical protein